MKSLRATFHEEWKPIFTLMEEGVTLPVPRELDAEFLKASYEQGSAYIKEQRASYLYLEDPRKGEPHPETWTLGTWSQRTKRSSIEAVGTASDIANLPVATTHRNRKRPRTA